MSNDWKIQHNAALVAPRSEGENIIGLLFGGAQLLYAGYYTAQQEYGNDAVLSEGLGHIADALASVATATLVLLNGEHGRIDAGTIDTALRNMVEGVGLSPDSI